MNKFDILCESDTHCVKRTVAVKPSQEEGNDEGFVAAKDGRIFIATTYGHNITIITPEGKIDGFIELDDEAIPTNCIFDGSDLIISDFGTGWEKNEKSGRIWRVSTDTKGHPIHRIGIELSSMSRITGSIGLLNLDWKGAPENLNFGTSRDLSPNLTPWNTNTFWTKSFVSSAKHFATDFYFTFALSHPNKEGVITTGTRDWINYEVSSKLILELHDLVGLVVRVRGHKRYYAGVVHKGKASIIKRFDDRFEILKSVPYFIEPNQALDFQVCVKKDLISLYLDNSFIIEASDEDFVSGGAGFIIETGTVPALGFSVKKIN